MTQDFKKRLDINNRQSGVTLLLSILILSAIMAISFSLATIIFIEVRTSGDLVRTEGAIFGADAISEQVLFKVKRKTPDFFSSPTIGLKNNVKIDKPVENSASTNVLNDMIQTSSKTFTTAKVYELYSTSTPGSGFARLEIVNNGPDLLSVYMCEFDPSGAYAEEPCTNATSTQYWINTSGVVIPNASDKFTNVYTGIMQGWDLHPDKVQRLVLINPAGSNILPITIQAFELAGASYVLKPLPLVGEVRVPIKADSSGAVRRIQLIIPNQ